MKVLLNADGGNFAFVKEGDAPDWSQSITRDASGDEPTPPAGDGLDHSDVLGVEKKRTAVIAVEVTSSPVDLQVQIYAKGRSKTGFFLPSNGLYRTLTNNKLIRVDCQGFDGLWCGTKQGNASLEYTYIPYED